MMRHPLASNSDGFHGMDPPTTMTSAVSPANDRVQPSSLASSRPVTKTRMRAKYAPKACQECRRRRAKCGGERPNCSRCQARQMRCTYTTESDGRGTAQKSYVRLLQMRIQLLERILTLHSIDVESSAARLSPSFTQSSDTHADVIPPSDDCSDPPHSPCPSLGVQGVLTGDEPLNFDGSGEARYFGSTSGRLDLRHQTVHTQSLSPVIFSDNSTQIVGLGIEVTEEVEDQLLSLYFTWEQPWLQIVDEKLFRESRRTGGRYYSELLLNCILANGSRFSDRLDIRTNVHDTNSAGGVFMDRAKVLLSDELKQPGITTLQALTVLGTVSIAMGQDAIGWMYHGMANRLIYDLGLNIDPITLPTSLCLTAEEAELRRQIYWSLYCVDKLASGYTGRVCMMLDFQGAVNLPSLPTASSGVNNADDLTRKSRLVSFHNALIALCKILEEIFVKLYAPKNVLSEMQRRAIFDTCKLSLRSWFYDLSEEFKFHKATAAHETVLPQLVALQMVYQTSIILLAKPFVSRHPASAEEERDPEQSDNDFTKTAIALYKGAAREVSTLADQYRQVFGSFRLSPITPTHSTLSATLALLSSFPRVKQSNAIGSGTVECIRSCLRTLSELSTSWTPARRYHESLTKLIKERGIEVTNTIEQDTVPVADDDTATPWMENIDHSMSWNLPSEDMSWLAWLSTIDAEWGDIEGVALFDLPLEPPQQYSSSMSWQ